MESSSDVLGPAPPGEETKLFSRSLESLLPDPRDPLGSRCYAFNPQKCPKYLLWVRPGHDRENSVGYPQHVPSRSLRTSKAGNTHMTKHNQGKHSKLREYGRQEPERAGCIREDFLEEVMNDLCLKK